MWTYLTRKERETEGVVPIQAYKDCKGFIWETLEKAAESSRKHTRLEEEGTLSKTVRDYIHGQNNRLCCYDLESALKGNLRDIYDILHKHYGKEGL